MDQKIEESVNKLFKVQTDKYIFIYTPPKVGSTTLVTSLRVSLGKSYNIVHIHDEVMLNVLTGINDLRINDIIHFLSNKGKEVYVIDVYRTPVERKMSEYFEKLSPYHFNNSEENLVNYNIRRISDRFNKLFPHLENGDHYFDQYNIKEPISFDFEKKYTLQEINNVKYVKLRLCDSELWSSILSNIFRSTVVIIYDYKTEDKGIGNLYKRFKSEYKLPKNYIELIQNCKYFNFYYNEEERNKYLKYWTNKLDDNFTPYTNEEYKFYMNLCLENQYFYDVQVDHYIDNGCFCKYCTNKRKQIFFDAKSGKKCFEKIIHVNEFKHIKSFNQISKKKFSTTQFKINITNK